MCASRTIYRCSLRSRSARLVSLAFAKQKITPARTRCARTGSASRGKVFASLTLKSLRAASRRERCTRSRSCSHLLGVVVTRWSIAVVGVTGVTDVTPRAVSIRGSRLLRFVVCASLTLCVVVTLGDLSDVSSSRTITLRVVLGSRHGQGKVCRATSLAEWKIAGLALRKSLAPSRRCVVQWHSALLADRPWLDPTPGVSPKRGWDSDPRPRTLGSAQTPCYFQKSLGNFTYTPRFMETPR